jgi:hypothetical protein
MGTGNYFLGSKAAGGVKLTTFLYVVPTLGMHGDIPPLTPYVFMAWRLIKYRILLHGMVLG